MKKFFSDRPWIWIVLGSVIMIAALAVVIVISIKNEPASVPLEQTNVRP